MIVQLVTGKMPNTLYEITKYITSMFVRIVIYSFFVLCMVSKIRNVQEQDIVSPKTYPIEAVQYIKNTYDVSQIRLYNEYNFGSYLLFEDIPVFIDSRADVYDPQFNHCEDDIFSDFLNIEDVSVDYNEKFDHYGITHLLIYKNSVLNKVLKLDTNYHNVFQDHNFIVYERENIQKGE